MSDVIDSAPYRMRRPFRLRMSLSTAILLGMALGIATGVFLGELAAPLGVVGTIFIKLLQMTILPYIVVSLIGGIGGLTFEKALLLVKRGGFWLLWFWVIAFAFILLVPLLFPSTESASFFSTALVQPPAPVDLVDLYIPANPFRALSENLVPAVVLFSIAVGVALIGVPRKAGFLDSLAVLTDALVKVAGFVVKLTPIGVFAIAASAAGTMTVGELSRLQVYLISFNLISLFIAFWVLPALVGAVTPFRYRDVVTVSRDALVTAFTTGNLFVVLPILIAESKSLFQKYGLAREDTDSYVDVLIPVTFNFPNIGKLIMLTFILFGAWFTGRELGFTDYLQFVFSGLLSFFGGVDVALPFMLDLMKMPTDLYQLYVVTGIVNGRTATLLAAMNLITFTLLTVASLQGQLQVVWRRLGALVLLTLVLAAAAVGGMRVYFETSVENTYTKDELLASMVSVAPPTEVEIHSEPKEAGEGAAASPPMPGIPPGRDGLTDIREGGVLRVGYRPYNLPFTFLNIHGDLVGFDADMARLLAHELDVKLEFVPVTNLNMADMLAEGRVHLVMSGVSMTTDRLAEMVFSAPYMDVNVALVVPDYRRKAFSSLEELRRWEGLRLAVPIRADDYYVRKLQEALPKAEILEIPEVADYFESGEELADALVIGAQQGATWTLLHPRYTVVVPEGVHAALPLGYPVARGDLKLRSFLDGWVALKKEDGWIDRFYQHWVLGEDAEPRRPRWSVLRNVLGWVD